MTRTGLAGVGLLALGSLLGYAAATGQLGAGRAAFATQKAPSADEKAIAYKLDRTALPIAEPKAAPITEVDARRAKAPPRFEVKAPTGAPNVLIVLIDDMGFGQSSAFGGPIHMPTLDKLA